MSDSPTTKAREKLVNYKSDDKTLGAIFNTFVALNGFWIWWYDSGIVATIGLIWLIFNLSPVVLGLMDEVAHKTRVIYSKEENHE